MSGTTTSAAPTESATAVDEDPISSLAERFVLTGQAILAGDQNRMACMADVFGMDRMLQFSVGVEPSSDELMSSEHCLIDPEEPVDAGHGHGTGGDLSSGGYSFFDEWEPATRVEGVDCPPADVNHADTGSFNFEMRPVLSGEVASFSVSPSQPNVVYMGIEENAHSVHRSTDFGETWTVLHRFDHAKDSAVHPTDSDIAFHADSSGIWRTSTGEPESYTRVLRGGLIGPPQAAFPTIVISPSNPDIVYTAQKGDTSPTGILDGGVVYRSTDGGVTFNRMATRTPVVNVLAVYPDNPDRLLLGSSNGIHESRDGGVTWQPVSTAKALGKVIDIRTNDGQTWHAATRSGVARSDNAGETWAVSDEGLPGPLVQRVEAVRDNPQVVWATTRSGVARSTDGGLTFDDVSRFGLDGGLPALNLQALAVWPDDPDMALVATSSLLFSARSEITVEVQGQLFGQGIFKTTDAGRSWRQVATGVAETTIIEIQTNPLRPTEVWAGQQASRGIFRSRDSGQSWSQSNTLLTHYPMKMEFVPGHPDRIVFTSSHPEEPFGLTTDSGVSWLTRSEQSFFDVLERGLELFDEQLRFKGNLHLHGLAVAPDDPNYVLVGSVNDPSGFAAKPLMGTHVFLSTDGGSSWIESMDGYDYTATASIHDIVFDPTDPDRVYLGTTAQESISGNGLWRSSDRGRTWERADDWSGAASAVNEVVVHPTDGRSVLAVTGGGLYLSTDRGDSWVRTQDSYAWDAEADLSSPGVVYAGTVDGVLASSDFGRTWEDITPDWLDPSAVGWGMVNVERSTGATSVGVSCDGGIVYAAFAGVGMSVSTAPGYGPVPEDPDQVSRMSGRAMAGIYDSHLAARRRTIGSTTGSTDDQSTESDNGASGTPLGPLAGLPEYAVDCARERLAGAWTELQEGRPATAEEQFLITACERSGGDAGKSPGLAPGDGSDGPGSGQSGARLADLPEPVVNCIRSQLGTEIWEQLWDGRPRTPDEQVLISSCEASGGGSGQAPGLGPDAGSDGPVPGQGVARLQDLPDSVLNCIRSQLDPEVWEQLWDGRPRTPDEQALISNCEASGGGTG